MLKSRQAQMRRWELSCLRRTLIALRLAKAKSEMRFRPPLITLLFKPACGQGVDRDCG